MGIIDTLKEQKHFTDTEKVLANYILSHLSDISRMTIYELSENSFCSIATVSRFCKKLQVKNFTSLKIDLIKENMDSQNQAEKVTYNFPFAKADSEEEIARKIMNLSVQTLQESFSSVDIKAIHNAACILDKAEIIDIYANWNSFVSALNLHSKLLWIGKNSNLEAIRGYQQVKAAVSDEKHVAVMVSYYGKDERNNQIVQRLMKNHVPYILITGPKINQLCLHAKQVIHVTPDEEYTDKIAAFSSDISLDYVVNLLYSFLFALHYDENMENRCKEFKPIW